LFILLEKNAADVARYYQFQKNNATERRRFISDVEPLFRQVQGLGGIDEYLIVCDETNNTPDVINAQTLVVDFYIRPTQSAEWIRLNFNATQAAVNFEELMASPV
jgi:phage tail sheath protein FI